MFWPVYSVSFTTTLLKEEALARLHAEVGRPKLFRLDPALPPSERIIATEQEISADFYGTQSPDGARFKTNFRFTADGRRFSDLFDAETICRIKSVAGGSVVHARIRLGDVMMACLLLLTASLIGLSIYSIAMTGGATVNAIAPIVSAAIAWTIACFFFSEHAQRTERLLRAGLERP